MGALDGGVPYGEAGPDVGAYGDVPDSVSVASDEDDGPDGAAPLVGTGPNGDVRSPVPDAGTPDVGVDAVGASCDP